MYQCVIEMLAVTRTPTVLVDPSSASELPNVAQCQISKVSHCVRHDGRILISAFDTLHQAFFSLYLTVGQFILFVLEGIVTSFKFNFHGRSNQT